MLVLEFLQCAELLRMIMEDFVVLVHVGGILSCMCCVMW